MESFYSPAYTWHYFATLFAEDPITPYVLVITSFQDGEPNPFWLKMFLVVMLCLLVTLSELSPGKLCGIAQLDSQIPFK